MFNYIVYIHRNTMDVVNLTTGDRASGSAPFTSERLLIGVFPVAEGLLRELFQKVRTKGFLAARPRMIIQPMAMTEGGLCAIEERAFVEVGLCAGAREARVYLGEKLTREKALSLTLRDCLDSPPAARG